VGIASAAGLTLGGYVVKLYGIKSIFYIASSVIALSTIFLFSITEEKTEEQGTTGTGD
jgi:predicted MFS family arabinose efflux permease